MIIQRKYNNLKTEVNGKKCPKTRTFYSQKGEINDKIIVIVWGYLLLRSYQMFSVLYYWHATQYRDS